MLYEASCPQCQHQFQANSLYGGTRRSCPACKASFVLEVPTATKALARERHEQDQQRRKAATTPPPMILRRLGCSACGFVSAVQLAGTEPVAACRMCGHRSAMAQALELGAALDAAEQEMWLALVQGFSEPEVSARMAARGLPLEQARAMVHKRAIDLPLVRFRVLQRIRGGDSELELGCPQACDLCRARLPAPVRAHVIVWKRLDSTERSLSPWTALSIFAGVALYEKQSYETVMTGVYFACEACRGALTARVFGAYRGHPVDQGFKLASIKRLG